MAEAGDLQAIAMIGDRLDGKVRQSTDVTLRTAAARELSDDDLAAIVVGAEGREVEEDPKPAPTIDIVDATTGEVHAALQDRSFAGATRTRRGWSPRSRAAATRFPAWRGGSSTVIPIAISTRYCRGPTESNTSEPWPENIAYERRRSAIFEDSECNIGRWPVDADSNCAPSRARIVDPSVLVGLGDGILERIGIGGRVPVEREGPPSDPTRHRRTSDRQGVRAQQRD
jgi:hypothetical protein